MMQQSPTIHDKENNRLEINSSNQNFNSKSILAEVAENSKIDESIIEDNLTCYQRITHPKWTIRRKIYVELIEEFSSNTFHEFQSAWLKNIINDNNQFAAFEGLKFIEVFVKSTQMNSHVLPYFIGDLLERGGFMKQGSSQIILDILLICCNKDTSYIFSEIFRKFDIKHPKVVTFCQSFIIKFLSYNNSLNRDLIKTTFKYSILHIKNTNKNIRQQAITIFTQVFGYIQESFEDLKKLQLDSQLRQIQVKELETACSKVQKRNQLIKIEDGQQVIQIIDLHQLLPDKFFELPYYKPNERKAKMANFARNLEKFNGEIDVTKDYSSIYHIIVQVLEESNFLIYSEGMKCVKGLVKLLRKNISYPIARHFFFLILDKLKGTLSKQHQSAVFNILEDLLLYESINCDVFIDLIINNIESGKNLGVRQVCIRWLKDGWLALALSIQNRSQSNQQVLKNFAIQNGEKVMKSLLILYRKVQILMKKENNLNFKRACSDFLQCLQVDEATQTIRVIEEMMIAEPEQQLSQESRIDIQQPLQLLKQKQKSKTVDKQRYTTEEDICEVAFLAEQISNRHQTRQSFEWPSNFSKEQQEFMTKFMIDIQQIKKLATNGQDAVLQNKIDEIIANFKNNCQQTQINNNDFLQQLTKNIVKELYKFTKKLQFFKKGITDKVNDLILFILILLNKVQITLEPELLVVQLKTVFNKLQIENTKLHNLLESLYICCSLESMIRASVKLINKFFCSSQTINYKPYQYYIGWIGQKFQSAPQQQIDPGFVKLVYKQFEQLQKQLTSQQAQLDLRQFISIIQSKMTFLQSQSIDHLSDAYNDLINYSVRRSKSKSFGSQVSSFETPNKPRSRLDFASSEEKDIIDNFSVIEQSLQLGCNNLTLDNLINYLNRYRASQLSVQSSHVAFLSPNSRSPGKHWRRGMGRENMIINTPGRVCQDMKSEDFLKVIEFITKNYTENLQPQIFQVFYLVRNIFPQSLNQLIYYILNNICTHKCENQENNDRQANFVFQFLQQDSQLIYQVYKTAFNNIYLKNQGLELFIQQAYFPIIKIFQTELSNNLQFFCTTLVFMLQTREYQEYASLTLNQCIQISNYQRIIEVELIQYKKLYDTFIQWQCQTIEPPTPQLKSLQSFGAHEIQKTQNNQILVVDLQQLEECMTKREETARESHNFLQFNKEDFELLESTTKNQHNTQNTLRLSDEEHPEILNNDLLNLQQYISPLQQYSQFSIQDPVIQEIAKNLYRDDKTEKQKQTLNELEQIKQMNDSFRRRDSHKTQGQNQLQQQHQGQNYQTIQSQQSQHSYQGQQIKQLDIQKIYQDIHNQSSINTDKQTLLSDILAPIEQQLYDATKNQKRNDCIKHLQEILLTSTSLYFDVASTLMMQYEALEQLEDKVAFIEDLKLSLINKTLLTNINEQNFAVIVAIVLKLCTVPSTQSEIYTSQFGYDENQLTKSLQLILDVLLRSKSNEIVIITLIRVFSEHLPLDFSCEITKNEKMMLRLNMKCIERLVTQADDINTFPILVEILKFFKFHPPENLVEGLPSIKELELYFKQLKAVTDILISQNKQQAQEFIQFVYRKNNKCLFIEYVKSIVDKL